MGKSAEGFSAPGEFTPKSPLDSSEAVRSLAVGLESAAKALNMGSGVSHGAVRGSPAPGGAAATLSSAPIAR